MTELEALAKDCIENHTHKLIDKPTKQDIYLREESIYIQGYRECERRDKKHIAELEAQIEKMKRCDYMCKNYNWQGCVFSSAKATICHKNKLCLFELRN